MVTTPPGWQVSLRIEGVDEDFWVASFDGEEAISRLFRFDVDISSAEEIDGADILGKAALLTIATYDIEPRRVHGIVSRFEQSGEGLGRSAYRVTLVPRMWRMVHRHDSRIFQDQTIAEIIERVFVAAGLDAEGHRFALSSIHPKREYCVQYRESDWAFVSRLMEEEGVFCFFEQSAHREVLVIGDAKSVHRPIAGGETIRFREDSGALAHDESVTEFSYAEEVRPGKVSLGDFDFKKPALALGASSSVASDADLEVYDHPGEYDSPDVGTALAKVRLEELRSVQKVGRGTSSSVRLVPGSIFELADHPRESRNRGYLITRARHEGSTTTEGAEAGGHCTYLQRFEVIPDDVAFRPARLTPRPSMRGVQTAIVVGPGSEEIYTDEHGRVKVQFHWDRQGHHDEKSSCWIRVSQLWAGAGWGSMWIPRIGHEVIVEFIEGDPDRPIIVGRVYHGANPPPYALPAEKTKSTIKSNSSPGGDGSNELRFEDRKGSEEIYLHAEKDWNIGIEHDKGQIVGHDERLEVGRNRSKEVRHDQSETIGNDKTIDVGRDHNESVGKNESVMIGANAERSVGGDQLVSVGGACSVEVAGDVTMSAGGALSVEVGAHKSETVGGNSGESVSGDRSTLIEGGTSLKVQKGMVLAVGKDASETVGGEKKIEVGKTYTLTVGEGSITVEKSGNISIHGKDLTITGTGKLNVQGGQKIVLKSDGPVVVEAASSVKVKGSAVNMN